MESKFKVGDKVRLTEQYIYKEVPLGTIGQILEVRPNADYANTDWRIVVTFNTNQYPYFGPQTMVDFALNGIERAKEIIKCRK